jgi:WD40 repeat protein
VTALPWPTEALGYFPEHRLILHARQDGKLVVLDPASGAVRATLEGHPRTVNEVLLDEAGRTLISGCVVTYRPDGTPIASAREVWVWNLPGGGLRRKIAISGEIMSLALSKDGRTLAVGLESEIELWNLSSGQRTRKWGAHKIGVISLAFSSDGSLLVSGSYDNLAKVWTTATGELRQTLAGHASAVIACFSPDGRTIATAADDSTLRLWSVTVGRELLRITREGWPRRIGFSPNGRYLAMCELSGRVLVYDALTQLVE